MGWYFRKSVKIGPVRVNFSKGGVGYSVGVRGARIGVKPNGATYLHVGLNGLYYRQSLNVPQYNIQRPFADNRDAKKVNESQINSLFVGEDVSQFAKSSRNELVKRLRDIHQAPRIDQIVIAVGIVVSLVLYLINIQYSAFSVVVFTLLASALYVWEQKRRATFLQYQLTDEENRRFTKMIDAINHLASCDYVWQIQDEQASREWKYNGGATSLVKRKAVVIGEGLPPWVKTNVSVPTMQLTNRELYFLPDGILVYDSKNVGHIDYDSVHLMIGKERFIEDTVPLDAQVVGHTWEHPNKNGGPDLRFANNRQLPICIYGTLRIESKEGLRAFLQTSKEAIPEKFKTDFSISHESDDDLSKRTKTPTTPNTWPSFSPERASICDQKVTISQPPPIVNLDSRQQTEVIEFDWVTVPAGEFKMGSDKQIDRMTQLVEVPQHSVYLPEYRISRTPITVAQFNTFVNATNHNHGFWNKLETVNNEPNYPAVWISWFDAQAFCKWANVRLPTEAEWEKAARGTDARIWPWGNQEPNENLCHFKYNAGSPLTPVQQYPQGASYYGVLDMAGGIWEWTNSLHADYPYNANDGREDPNAKGKRILRGGCFKSEKRYIRCASRTQLAPSTLNFNGFRVVSNG